MKTSTTGRKNISRRWTRVPGIFGFTTTASVLTTLFLIVFMGGCKPETPGIVNVCTAPTVIRTSPDNGGTNVPLNKTESITAPKKIAAVKIITATFSTPMNGNTITSATFTLVQGTTPISGIVSYTDTTASFVAPSGLGPNLTYTCTITTGVKSAAGTSLANNYVWSFTTIAAGTPTLVSPVDVAINQSVNPTMIWNAVPNADTYRLQVSTDPNFITTTVDDSTITGTSQTISGLIIGTTYYWRVNSRIGSGTSTYSDVWSFTTITAPLAPVLVSPIVSAINISTTPTMSWNTSAGAATYRLQVSLSSGFASTVYDNAAITGTSQPVSGLVLGTVYYWRVNAKNAAGTSPYSTRSFTTIEAGTPTLISPVDGAFNQSVNPTLIWNSVPGANTYRLQVSTSNSFATTVYNDSTRTSTSQVISGLTIGTTYYWRVNSKISGGTSAYSDIWSFTTLAPPVVPLLVAPRNTAVDQSVNPTMIWNNVPGADTYRLQVSTSNTFAATVYDDSTRTSTSQALTGLTIGTTYYWRVNAKNVAGTSAYSTVWSFTTIVSPAAPVLISPVNAAVNQSVNPTMIWNDVPGADSYRLQVSTSNTFTTTVFNDSTISGTSQGITGLTIGTTYYWRVNAKNLAGTSAYSTVWSFTTINSPAAPVLVSPINGSIDQALNPVMVWNPVLGATTYRLQISTSNSFATTVYNDSTRIIASQQVSNLTAGTIYYWRVNAKNIAGTSAYSSIWSFTTIAAPAAPAPPVLVAPLNLSTNISTTPTLSWKASINASTYRLQVSTVNTFATTVFNDSTLTDLLKPITGLTASTTYYWRVNAKNSAGTSAYSTIWQFTTGTGLAPGAVALGAAGTYGIMATSAVTNTGNSVINGDVSLDPGTSITGFTFSTSPGPGIVNGTVHINDTESAKARQDLLTAYNYAKGKPSGTIISAGADLGALYPLGIPPGTYTSGSTMLVSTNLVLDGGGNANAVWVFQIGSSLTTGANVTLTGSAQAKNVFWVPTEDATIGVGTIFNGTIVSGRDVTAVTGATIYGRILAGATTDGTIALQTAVVNVPLP